MVRPGMWFAWVRGSSSSAPKPDCATAVKQRMAHQPELEAVIHTCLLNRGCLIAPFHNMMLVSPVTTKTQIRRLVAAFDETLTLLFAEKN